MKQHNDDYEYVTLMKLPCDVDYYDDVVPVDRSIKKETREMLFDRTNEIKNSALPASTPRGRLKDYLFFNECKATYKEGYPPQYPYKKERSCDAVWKMMAHQHHSDYYKDKKVPLTIFRSNVLGTKEEPIFKGSVKPGEAMEIIREAQKRYPRF